MKVKLIIGDIAGRYETLLTLIQKAEKFCEEKGYELEKIISVGDMPDRGPKSKEVLYFFKDDPRAEAVLGNHDHMMLNTCLDDGSYYDDDLWTGWNGGTATVKSFYPTLPTDEAIQKIKEEHGELLAWMSELPLYIELDGAEENSTKAFISHAIKNPAWSLDLACDLGECIDRRTRDSIIWNRGSPRRMEDRYQVCGHNSHWGLQPFNDEEGEYGICLDTSRQQVLTGLLWPTKDLIQQDYIDTFSTVADAFGAAGLKF